MADIIEAFVASIGFDTRAYDRGAKQVQANDKKTRDQFRESAKDIEQSGKRASSYFRGLRNEAVGLFLAFAGASTLKGFIADTISGAASTGRLAANIGVATENLSAWQGALKSVGGQSGDADSTFRSLNALITNRTLRGDVSQDPNLNALGVGTADLKNGPEAVLMKIADASKRMTRSQFGNLGAALGLSESTITLLAKGRAGLEAVLEEQRRLGVVTDEDAKKAAEFERQWAAVTTTLQRQLLPYLVQTGEALQSFVTATQDGTLSAKNLEGPLVALGVAATVVGAPFVALAAAIALVATNYNKLKSTWSGFEEWWKGVEVGSDKYLDPLRKTLMGGKTGADLRAERGVDVPVRLPGGAGAATTGGGGGGNAARISAYLKAQGFSDNQVRGIVAGIHAENGSFDPNAVNPTSGAHGIGQWLGPRRAAFRKLIGRDIVGSTLEQQMRFLAHELRGGDHGGAAVMGQTTAEGTLGAYVHNFMRPGAGASGDMRRGMRYLGGRMPAGGMGGGGGTSSTTVGQIIVYSPDPDRAGQNVQTAMRKRGLVTQSNSGLSQ